MASGDVWKVTLGLELDAVECRPGFYLIEGGGGGGGNPAQNVGSAVEDALGATPLAGFIQNLTLSTLIITDCQPATRATFVYNLTPHSGTIADDNPPAPQNSMLIHMGTDIKSSKGNFASHGRMYMPGIYSTGQISGFLTVDLQNALEVFRNKLDLAFVADGTAYQMNVVSFNPPTSPPTPRTIRAFQPVTSTTTSNRVRSQNRRQPGRGI